MSDARVAPSLNSRHQPQRGAATRKDHIMATKQTAPSLFPKTPFDPSSASLTEFNKELKRLASLKCRCTNKAFKSQYAKRYNEIAAIKSDRFTSSRVSYHTLTPDQISELDLAKTTKAIKSLQSAICLYPNRKQEILPQLNRYQEHRAKLKAAIMIKQAEETLNK